MYIAKSVAKPVGISPGSASPKKPNVTIFDFDDVAYMPPRDSNGIVVYSNIIMKPLKSMHQVYMTRSKTSAPYESDGEEDSMNIKQSFEGQHPGNKKEIREFIQNWIGRNVGIIHETCDGSKDMVGTLCAPLQLKPSGQDNNDGRFHMLKFEAFATSQFLPAIYNGGIPLMQPTLITVVAPIAVNTLETGSFLKLPAFDATEAIGLKWSSIEDGGVITLFGSGGADPAILLQGPGSGAFGVCDVLLKNANNWVALDGAWITLQAYGSAGVNYFLEKERG
jgi:hypothetical protein